MGACPTNSCKVVRVTGTLKTRLLHTCTHHVDESCAMHVSSSELLEYTKGVLCTASWRYTTGVHLVHLVHLVILWRSSTKAYICRRHCLHLSKTLQPAHEQTPPISTSHVRLLISFNTHQELNEKLIVQPEKDAPAKLTGCWGALLAVGLSSRSSSSGDASAMALSTSSMTSSSRTAAVLFRCIFEWRL